MGCSQSSSVQNFENTSVDLNKVVEGAKRRRQSMLMSSAYDLKEELGRGAFSVVRKGVHKETSTVVAVKCVDRNNLPQEDEDSLRTEVSILRDLDHHNIVKCLDFFVEPMCFYLVMEFMTGGELFDRIVKKTYYNEREARDLVQGLLSAVQYIHKKNIVHRDLKPENLLLSSREDDSTIKIADFGFAAITTSSNLKTRCGTPNYVAPEILSNDLYGKPVDMWSIGVITYVLLGGYPPFDDENEQKLFKKIKRSDYEFHPDFWRSVSKDAKDLIRKLLVVDPNNRMTAEDAMKHPWVRRNAKELEKINLNENLATLKKYATTRKLKAAVRVVIAANRFRRRTSYVTEGTVLTEAETETDETRRLSSVLVMNSGNNAITKAQQRAVKNSNDPNSNSSKYKDEAVDRSNETIPEEK
mmetsp:Transcript_20193/g.20293  ORF Transcript_20193/g.20293 Transcript_20193/m.20293 type:complete len:413 (-) Transcript_20193:169-1407(-)|eukprot:CAMPEP_0182421232 /NCGR_PEP_ID=MMETSP1167-20130531/6525_1 /TAXON_ID=2988 /ORGANISM="Mallomonas Sp, Strain CCMP3275" /LENGTH=412 /DNA_ID=CAMNT_0024598151 /DNA_START=98 /DNA_END=1336 /DNA_ORIENTATION=+